ncbi:MAG: family 16 glycoside hydrolase [Bacteroidota bacterium]
MRNLNNSANTFYKCIFLAAVFFQFHFTAYGQQSKITVNAGKIENRISPLIYGSNIEDVNHEIYGGFYDQRIFGESFEEPATGVNYNLWRRYTGYWLAKDDGVTIVPGRQTHSMVEMNGMHQIGVEPDQSAKLIYEPGRIANGWIEAELKFIGKGESAGLLVRTGNVGVGNDNFDGYEISLARNGKSILLGKHVQNFQLLKQAIVNCNPDSWNKIKVLMVDSSLVVYLNGMEVLYHTDAKIPLMTGKIGLRTWQSAVHFRKIQVGIAGKFSKLPLVNQPNDQVSYNWDIIKNAGAKVSFILDSTTAYNSRYAQLIDATGNSGKVGIANRGLNRWGIAIKQNQRFEGRLYLKAASLTSPVVVALESADGIKTYAQTLVYGVGSSWKKHTYSLISKVNDPAARLAIYVTGKGKLWIDQVVLNGTGSERFKGLPIRADIGNMLVQQGVTFLRYAGTMVNSPEYRFKNMIGDPDKRPMYRGHWNHHTTNGFGIEEFLSYCEQTGITPCFAINIYETPEDMADMVEYLNGDINTVWGSMRVKNGHPKPYGIKYIEIGNEEVIFNGDNKAAYENYVDRFNLLYAAMKAKDRSLKFVHAAWWRPNSDNMEYVFKSLNGKADYWDLHVGGDDPAAGLDTDKQLKEMKRLFKKWDPETKMKVAIFEENGSKHGMQRALGHATNLNAVRRHGEFVLTSSPANALQPYLQNDNDWDQGQIFFTSSQVWGMPPFYSQQMQAANHLPLRVSSEVDGGLDVSATRSEDGKILILHVVNTEGKGKTTQLNFEGFEGRKMETEIIVLAGGLNQKNSQEHPTRYKQQTSTIKLASTYTFPAYSYTILKLRRQI